MLNLETHEIPIFNICLFIRVCAWCLNLDDKICKKNKKKKKNSPFKNITDSNIRIGSLLHG